MRSRMLVAAGLAAGLVTSTALAEEGYRHGRVRFVEPGVTLQRATEVSAEEALANLPFLPGDRVWTDSAGRAEFQFPDGTLVRLDRRSKLDYSGHEEGQEERIVLRLWSGSTFLRVRTRGCARFEVETPAGTVQALDRGMLRVDVEAGETRVSVYAGEAVLDDGRRQVRLAAGERTFARWGAEAEEPRRFEPGEENDDFAQLGRHARVARSAGPPAPPSTSPTSSTPTRASSSATASGSTRARSATSGSRASRSAGSPTRTASWAWTPYGWTWVPYERWGWAPSHYGRWGHSASFGWYWMPGRTWGPGWVSWAVGGGYVGWCPLGWRDQPVRPWGYGRHSGHAVPRGRYGRGPLERRAPRRPRGPRRGPATRGLRPDRAGRPPRGGLGRPAAHARRAQPARRRRRPARHQPAADARRFRARAGRRQQDDDPGALDARLRAAAGGSRRGALRRAAPIGRRRRARTPGPTHPTSGSASRPEGARPRRGRASARRRGTRRARRRAPSGERGTAARPAPSAGAESRRSGSVWRHAAPPGIERPRGACRAHREERARLQWRSPAERGRELRRLSARAGGGESSGRATGARLAASGGESSSGYRPRSGGDSSGGSQPRAERSAPRPPRNEGGGSQPARRAAARAGRAPVATPPRAPAATGSSPPRHPRGDALRAAGLAAAADGRS